VPQSLPTQPSSPTILSHPSTFQQLAQSASPHSVSALQNSPHPSSNLELKLPFEIDYLNVELLDVDTFIPVDTPQQSTQIIGKLKISCSEINFGILIGHKQSKVVVNNMKFIVSIQKMTNVWRPLFFVFRNGGTDFNHLGKALMKY
jgi:hypothetical protein